MKKIFISVTHFPRWLCVTSWLTSQPTGQQSDPAAPLVLQSGDISQRLDTQICHWQGGRDGCCASQTLTHPSPVWSSVFRLVVCAAC